MTRRALLAFLVAVLAVATPVCAKFGWARWGLTAELSSCSASRLYGVVAQTGSTCETVTAGTDIVLACQCNAAGTGFVSIAGGGADGVGYDEILDEASGLTKRAQVNFTGAGVSCVDNAGATRTDCTIAGGGAADSITEGDSNVEVVDAGTGQIHFDLDAALAMLLSGSGLDLSTGGGGLSLGESSLLTSARWIDVDGVRDSASSIGLDLQPSWGDGVNTSGTGLFVSTVTESAATVGTLYGIRVSNNSNGGGGSTIANSYGLYLDDQTSGGTISRALHVELGGEVALGIDCSAGDSYLTTNAAGVVACGTDNSGAGTSDIISEADSNAEIIDTGTGQFDLDLDGSNVARIFGDLVAATGDEISAQLTYTVNKATSGRDDGLLIAKTDTASPGVSCLVRATTDAAERYCLDDQGGVIWRRVGGSKLDAYREDAIIVDNEPLGWINFGANDTQTGDEVGARIIAYSAAEWTGASQHAGDLHFQIVPAGVSTPQTVLTLGDGFATFTEQINTPQEGVEFPSSAITDCNDFGAMNGGIFYDGTGNKLKKCEDGTLSDLDTGGGGGGTAGDAAGARATQSTATTCSSGSACAITFDAEAFDSDAFHDTSTNSDRLTAPAGLDGRYVVTSTVYWASNASGSRTCRILKNNTTIIAEQETDATAGADANNCAAIVDLAATDYVNLVGVQSSGGNLDTAIAGTEFALLKVESTGSEFSSLTLTPSDAPPTCNAGAKGQLYYDDSLSELCDCDGSSWAQVDGGGAC